MTRLAALVAAAAMIAGAFVVRQQVIEGGGRPAGRRDGPSRPLVCAREFRDEVCDEEASTETTFEQVVDGDARITWLTAGPWPQIADEARQAASKPRAFGEVEVVATTRLAVVVPNGVDVCTQDLTWKCIGDAARDPNVRVAGPATDTGLRVLVHAAMLSSYLGTTDFASNDVRDVPEVADWIAGVDDQIDRGREFGATSLRDFLVKTGSAHVFVTTESEARRLVRGGGFRVLIPAPEARVEAVAGHNGKGVPDDVVDALEAAGWSVPPRTGGDDGLPSPGVLLALREVTS